MQHRVHDCPEETHSMCPWNITRMKCVLVGWGRVGEGGGGGRGGGAVK